MNEIYNKLKQLLDNLIQRIEVRKKEVLDLENKLISLDKSFKERIKEINQTLDKVEKSLSFWVSLSKEEQDKLITEIISKIETSEIFLNSAVKEKLKQLEEEVKTLSLKQVEKLEKTIKELREEIKKIEKPSTAFVPVGSKSYVDVFNSADTKIGTSDRLKFLNSNLSYDADTKTIIIEPLGNVRGSIATGQIAFGTATNTIGGDNNLYWDNTNKRLGIGTTTPTEKLQIVNGNIQLDVINTGGLMIGTQARFGVDNSNQATIRMGTGGLRIMNNAQSYISVFIQNGNYSYALFINSSGNVGIGTGSPTAKLHIAGSTGYNQLRLATSYTPTGTSDTNGNVGDIAWDNNYIYVKTSAGWKRAALTTF